MWYPKKINECYNILLELFLSQFSFWAPPVYLKGRLVNIRPLEGAFIWGNTVPTLTSVWQIKYRVGNGSPDTGIPSH